jgi:hypothetical protein
VAPHLDDTTTSLAAGNPARLAVVLNGFGGTAIILAVLFFGGSFYVENEIGRAFCLGAFFSGLLGGIVLFGFAKIIDMLDAIRQQTIAAQSDYGPLPGSASEAATVDRSSGSTG